MKKLISTISIVVFLVGVTYTVSAQTSAPVFENVADQIVRVGQTLQFTIRANNLNNETTAYNMANLPRNATFNATSGNFSWTPLASQLGGHTLIFSATNGSYSSGMSVYVNVVSDQNSTITNSSTVTGNQTSTTNVSQPPTSTAAPVFTSFNPPAVAYENQLYRYDLKAAAADGKPIIYRLISGPDGMFVNSSTGILGWVPNAAHVRVEPYQVVVSAYNSFSETARSYNLTVVKGTAPATNQITGTVPSKSTTGNSSKSKLTINDVKLETSGQGEITVSWNTNLEAIGWVVYDANSKTDRPDNNYDYSGAAHNGGEPAEEHEVVLGFPDNEPKIYYFRIFSQTNDETVVSDEMVFALSPNGQITTGLASIFSTLGDFIFSPAILSLLVIVLAAMLYRAKKKLA